MRLGGERRYSGIARDLSERKQAEEQLNLFFTLSLDILGIWTLDGYFTRVSPAFSKTVGWSTEEILARPLVEFVHPDDRAATLREIEKMASYGRERPAIRKPLSAQGRLSPRAVVEIGAL